MPAKGGGVGGVVGGGVGGGVGPVWSRLVWEMVSRIVDDIMVPEFTYVFRIFLPKHFLKSKNEKSFEFLK